MKYMNGTFLNVFRRQKLRILFSTFCMGVGRHFKLKLADASETKTEIKIFTIQAFVCQCIKY